MLLTKEDPKWNKFYEEIESRYTETEIFNGLAKILKRKRPEDLELEIGFHQLKNNQQQKEITKVTKLIVHDCFTYDKLIYFLNDPIYWPLLKEIEIKYIPTKVEKINFTVDFQSDPSFVLTSLLLNQPESTLVLFFGKTLQNEYFIDKVKTKLVLEEQEVEQLKEKFAMTTKRYKKIVYFTYLSQWRFSYQEMIEQIKTLSKIFNSVEHEIYCRFYTKKYQTHVHSVKVKSLTGGKLESYCEDHEIPNSVRELLYFRFRESWNLISSSYYPVDRISRCINSNRSKVGISNTFCSKNSNKKI